MSQDSRPLSPHLQVYKLPLLAKLSIFHRFTGIALAACAILLPWVLTAIALGGGYFDFMYHQVSAWYGIIILIGATYALCYHLCNGVRHLFWDIGKGFEVATADKSARAVLVVSVVLTAIIWLIAFFA